MSDTSAAAAAAAASLVIPRVSFFFLPRPPFFWFSETGSTETGEVTDSDSYSETGFDVGFESFES